RLALAGAGIDDQQAFLGDRLRGDLGVLHRLALFHLRLVACRFVGHFTPIGRPATMKITRSARRATRWLSRPCSSRKARARAFSGTIDRPTSFDTMTTG